MYATQHRRKPLLILTLAILFIPACRRSAPPEDPAPAIGFIKVAPDNWTFVDSATGKTFTPVGCNYYDAHTGWAPHFWAEFDPNHIERDFARMKDLGVNIARIPILTGNPWIERLGPSEFKANPDTVANFLMLLQTAKKHEIRLILSVFYWEGYPGSLGDMFTSEEALAYQEFGYKLVARLVKDEPIVFSHTLLNEPRVGWDASSRWGHRSEPQPDTITPKWNQWLTEKYGTRDALQKAWSDLADDESLGNIKAPESQYEPNSQRLYDFQLFRKHLARTWVKRLVDAIKSEDNNHLISVGNVQWCVPFDGDRGPRSYTGFDPHNIADLLDYVSIHYYPFSSFHPEELTWTPSEQLFNDWIHSAEAFVRYSYVGKPVILEEFNWGLTPRQEHLEDPNNAELIARWNKTLIQQTTDSASGWLLWAFQDAASARDISNAGGFLDAEGNLKPWGREFVKLAKSLKDKNLERKPAATTLELDEKSLLTSDEALRNFWTEYLALGRQGKSVDFDLKTGAGK